MPADRLTEGLMLDLNVRENAALSALERLKVGPFVSRLREIADRGVPVVVGSSDTKELEGLCDRVIVMSRGHAVATFEGDDVTEEKIVHAAISATAHASEQRAKRA